MSDWAGLPAGRNSQESLHWRRGRCALTVTGTLAFLLIVAGCNSDGSASVSGPPQVVFFAEGSGTASAAVTMRTESGGVIQMDVGLPMTNAETGKPGIGSDKFKRGDPLSILAQNKEAGGSVTCRIEVDGKVIDEATSSGAFKVVTCAGKVP
jgi:hypothetical protein